MRLELTHFTIREKCVARYTPPCYVRDMCLFKENNKHFGSKQCVCLVGTNKNAQLFGKKIWRNIRNRVSSELILEWCSLNWCSNTVCVARTLFCGGKIILICLLVKTNYLLNEIVCHACAHISQTDEANVKRFVCRWTWHTFVQWFCQACGGFQRMRIPLVHNRWKLFVCHFKKIST